MNDVAWALQTARGVSPVSRMASGGTAESSPYTFHNDVTGASRGETYGAILAKHGPSNTNVGYIQYGASPQQTRIHDIQVHPDHRRNGVAASMMDHLKSEFPHNKVNWGMTTPEGEQFKRAYYQRADGGTLSQLAQIPQYHHPHAHAHPIHKLHTGPLHSTVAGRTDHLPSNVPNGSYVLPADIVSAMGEGNTMHGFKVAKRMFSGAKRHFGGTPYAGDGGPYGQGATPYGMADGGSANGVPVAVAGGEHVLAPHEVAHAGMGDMDAGHRALDEFVLRQRKMLIKTLKGLPGPKRGDE